MRMRRSLSVDVRRNGIATAETEEAEVRGKGAAARGHEETQEALAGEDEEGKEANHSTTTLLFSRAKSAARRSAGATAFASSVSLSVPLLSMDTKGDRLCAVPPLLPTEEWAAAAAAAMAKQRTASARLRTTRCSTHSRSVSTAFLSMTLFCC